MLSEGRETLKEVIQAVTPIALIVLIVLAVLTSSPVSDLVNYCLGVIMLIAGITLFLIGVNNGLLPMGEAIGSDLPKHGSIYLVICVAFIFGFLATVAEPDVRVLTDMVEMVSNGGIPRDPMIISIAMGVGIFVALAMLRIVVGVPITWLFTGGYLLVIVLAFLTPAEYLQIAYDAGGVTTGPLTVPFILALGIGLSSVLAGRSALTDGFGLIGLASIGPIIGIMLLGILL
ncbi:MAG: Uncharacterized protein XE11_0658 [Methanomicrobiales archaeon 53_19]|jgi:hypothetical protein|uniref:DUF1538 domain-containing protein n=1 Tax=Methanocalculus sp. TaxID=2004547 RepID=UPI00074A43DD|nr:DUF1538 domain-containing protein [Methanocalculus sp.]KUK70059.1 MAG: Uncharacterized protein XD88_0893 [Methanocalculus sp. 52_23]KUL04406.1 MAG: Uncharacterized protein XE11_0658 [Methanomicrobiales archaeon 53_19]HIJ07012.1 DUF1538 domain-containing protein [Methanocalculus sp.]